MSLATRRIVLTAPRRYLFEERFAGTALSTARWNVTDSEGVLSVSGGKLNFAPLATPANNDPRISATTSFVPPPAGLTLEAELTFSNFGTAGGNSEVGFDTSSPTTLDLTPGILVASNTGQVNNSAVGVPLVLSLSTSYRFKIIHRGAATGGALWYVSTDAGLTWKILGVNTTSYTTSTIGQHARSATGTCDYILAYRGALPVPVVSDTFTRSDSALTLGSAETLQAYTAHAGTWGITSNQGYSVTDADADLATLESGLNDGVFTLSVKGTLNSATDYRIPELVVRMADTSNYLYVRMINGAVTLRKNDADSHSQLATAATTTADNTAYAVRAACLGTRVYVYVDGVLKISHTLAGGDATKYVGATYTRIGARLAKAGAPATAAVVDTLEVWGGIP